MTNLLIKNIDSPNYKFLVFTSAGDNAQIYRWIQGPRSFDLWVCYYGDEKNRYKDITDFYISRKGGKFPNLHYVYQHWKNILNHYKGILVIDDDIIIDSASISNLFKILEQYDLWLLQPSFDPIGKISHPITKANPFTFLRYTNFVEVTCPLFRKDKLDAFMEVYDPVLIGWGVDYWFLNVLGPNIKGKVAVIDAISCINPHNLLKGGQREIDLLQETPIRKKIWEQIKEQYNIKVQDHVEFDIIKNSLSKINISDFNKSIQRNPLNHYYMKRLAGIRQLSTEKSKEVNDQFFLRQKLYWEMQFPISIVKKENKIAIYGAGAFGKRTVSAMYKVGYGKPCVWADRNFKSIFVDGYQISSPDLIEKYKFDFIIIAIEDKNIIKEVREFLTNIGVPFNKLVWRDIDSNAWIRE